MKLIAGVRNGQRLIHPRNVRLVPLSQVGTELTGFLQVENIGRVLGATFTFGSTN